MNRVKDKIIYIYRIYLFYVRNYRYYKSLCFKNKLRVYDTEKTIKYLRDTHSSFSRFGDGEINLIDGIGNGFQNSNKKLALKLKEVLNSDISNLLIGIPAYFEGMDKFTWNAKLFFCEHLFVQGDKWATIESPKVFFGDALSTRFYIDYKDKKECKKIIDLWKSIWENRDVIIIEGDKTRLGINNDLFYRTRSIKRIICPNENAFDKYDEILDEALKLSNDNLILIALGQTATVLAYDLAKKGYQAIDIGHIDIEYEWYLMKSKKKCPIPYKYVNEIDDRDIRMVDSDNNYHSQIIKSII